MESSALEFSREHPDTHPGYDAPPARLEDRLSRPEQVATQLMDGLHDVSAAAERTKEVRQTLQRQNTVA